MDYFRVILALLLIVSAAILLSPLAFWVGRILWKTGKLYVNVGLTIYVEIFRALGPIIGTLIGIFLGFLYIAVPVTVVFTISTEAWNISYPWLNYLAIEFGSLRAFWKLVVVCVLILITKEYCKWIVRLYKKGNGRIIF